MYDLFLSTEVLSGHLYTNLIYMNCNLYRNISLKNCVVSPILIIQNVSSTLKHTLEKRRLYCDLTLCYKIIYNSNTRKNNNYKVKEQPSKINVRSNLFTNRVTRAWNSLSEVIVTAQSLSSFKSRLKQLDFNTFLIVKYDLILCKQVHSNLVYRQRQRI